MRLGVFGGTFDPPHVGHLIVAQDAWSTLELDELVFVPAALPPHKDEGAITSPALRLEMIRAAVAGDARFRVDPLELEREGPSWTVDTLRTLRERGPDDTLFLLIGADQFNEFGTWRGVEEILSLAELVVIDRGETDLAAGEAVLGGKKYRRLRATRVDVSSTEVRRRVRAGEPVRYLVPEGALQVMEREHLYRGAL